MVFFFGTPGTHDFFIQVWSAFMWGILIIHLTHWIINGIIEWRLENRGMAMKKETLFSYALLLFGFLVFAAVIVLTMFLKSFQYFFFSWPSPGYEYIAWVFTGVAVLVLFAFGWVHYSLGRSWSGTVVVKQDHKLVVTGPYHLARHPMYAVLLLAIPVTGALTLNPLITAAFSFSLFFPVIRFRKEERTMLEEFGDDYARYMKHVGAFCPFPLPWECLPHDPVEYELDHGNSVQQGEREALIV